MTTWTADTATTATWTRDYPTGGELLHSFASGSPYGLLLTITRPYTELVYDTGAFSEVDPTTASWTLREAS